MFTRTAFVFRSKAALDKSSISVRGDLENPVIVDVGKGVRLVNTPKFRASHHYPITCLGVFLTDPDYQGRPLSFCYQLGNKTLQLNKTTQLKPRWYLTYSKMSS